MTSLNLLVVEDEDAIRELLVMVLEQAGISVIATGSAEQAQHSLADNSRPDMVLLDWMLPGMSGVELARRLKQDDLFKDLPIILLTARGEEEDKVRGLEIGADDYITKPFSPRELIARIKAVLRRSGKNIDDEILNAHGIILDVGKHRISVANKSLDVSPTEFKLMHFFMTHQDNVYSRTQLLDQVWGRSVYIEERTVDVHIRRLRKILEKHQKDALIQTVRGFGYRFSMVE